ncbi:AraC-like ligand-binding domain-containing protein [Streptomyces atroolivaceus]|uniref:AraC-like ligand-binding domain-containing protein n=1 Tax=Streptomyces atroolivaceus TaxID=66869 RepID=UPI00363BAA0E
MLPYSSRPEPGQLPGTHYTAESQPLDRRRAHWREALSRTFGAVDMTVPDEVRSGTIQTASLGRLQAVTVDGDCLSALRTPRLVAQGGVDDYVVVKMLARGSAQLEQDGRTASLGPGDIFIYDLARPVRMHLSQAFRTKSLRVPKDVLGLSESATVHVTASPLGADSPLGGLLAPLLARLVDSAGTYPPRASELMARNVVDLIGVLTDEQLDRASRETSAGNRALLLQIQAFIDRHLADPDLTPHVIAQAHHISLRYLHKLFETEDATVGRWIQRRRLEACRRELARPHCPAIAAVAHRCGFTSAAHFSRVFRSAYGISPREWRDTQASVPDTTPSASRLIGV